MAELEHMTDNSRVVSMFFERQYAGDYDGAFALATSDFQWVVSSKDDAALNAAIPWAGKRFDGQAGYEALMAQLFGEYDVELFETGHYTDGGDRVLVEGHFRFRHKETGRIAQSDFIARFDMRDGKIASGQFFENTYAVALGRVADEATP